MILNNGQELNLALKFRIDDFDYVIYVTSETMKCFKCGKEGHHVRACPENEERETIHNNDGEGQEENNVSENQQEKDRDRNENKRCEDGEKSEQGANYEESVNKGNEEKLVHDTTEIENDVVGSLVEVESSRDIDMTDDDSLFKTPTLKIKTSGKRGGKKQGKNRFRKNR